MGILYVTKGYYQVQKQIFSYLRKKDPSSALFLFSPRWIKGLGVTEENQYCYNNPSLLRGTLFYIPRLKHIYKHGLLPVLKSGKYTVLHANMMFVDGYICRLAYEQLGIPYVLSVRDTDMNGKAFWGNSKLRDMGIENLKKAKAVVCLSPAYKKELLNKVPAEIRDEIGRKTHVIGNGINVFWHDNKLQEKKAAPGKTIRLITAGEITKRKNQTTVAKAAQILRDSGYDVSYSVIGKVKDNEVYDTLKEHEWIDVVPFLPKEDLIGRYRESDIFVMPSLTETFGLTYAEAMTQGLPVIYSQGQGFDEQFPEGTVGFHVNSNDPSEIADRIRDILDDYQAISERCVSNSSRFYWDIVIDRFCELYNS